MMQIDNRNKLILDDFNGVKYFVRKFKELTGPLGQLIAIIDEELGECSNELEILMKDILESRHMGGEDKYFLIRDKKDYLLQSRNKAETWLRECALAPDDFSEPHHQMILSEDDLAWLFTFKTVMQSKFKMESPLEEKVRALLSPRAFQL